jgi:hypothetical protein
MRASFDDYLGRALDVCHAPRAARFGELDVEPASRLRVRDSQRIADGGDVMNLKRLLVAMVLGSTAMSTSSAFAQGDRVREKIRPNRPLLYTGAGVIAASYIPPVIVAATSDRAADKKLFIPVAGPWLDLADRGGCAPNSCETEGIYKALLVTTGIAHIVGSGLIVSSFIVPEERVRTTAATKPVLLPVRMGKDGVGLSLSGVF